ARRGPPARGRPGRGERPTRSARGRRARRRNARPTANRLPRQREKSRPRAPPRKRRREPSDRKRDPAGSRTLILVKPDAFERALTGEVLARFERKGLRLAALKKMQADANLANEHYAEHSEKPFFGELVSFITGGPLVAAVLEGEEAVTAARQLIGATNPVEAA